VTKKTFTNFEIFFKQKCSGKIIAIMTQKVATTERLICMTILGNKLQKWLTVIFRVKISPSYFLNVRLDFRTFQILSLDTTTKC